MNMLNGILLLFISTLIFPASVKCQTFQYFTLDSSLNANSEQMGIGNNGRNDGLRLIVMGPYRVNFVEKLDSGAFRKKAKEDKEISYGSDNGYEEFKIKRIEENAYFRMGLSRESDTATSFFSLYTSVRKKSETVLSAILSKKQETASTEYFDNSKLVEGYTSIKNDSVWWRFLLNYPSSQGTGLNTGLNGFLTNGRDSLFIDFVYSDILRKGKKDPTQEKILMRSARGYTLNDQYDRQMAALIFKQNGAYLGAKKLGNFTGGELVIIGHENSKSAQLAIASLFSIMAGIQ